MATIVNTREVMLQTADYLNTQRAAKSFYTSTQPWTNLFTNADNPAVTNINKTVLSAFLDPFGQSSVKYVPTNTTGFHNINSVTLNPTTVFVSGAKVHQVIYVKDDGNAAHRLACRFSTNGTTARTMQYTFSPITGKFTASTVPSGWTNVTATVVILENSWYKIILSGTFTTVVDETAVSSSWLLTDNTGATTFLGNNSSGLYLYGFQTYYNVELPETVVGDTWYDAAANTTKIWNGYSFITVGGTSTAYNIDSTSTSIYKDAVDAISVGTYSSVIVTGKKTVGTTTTTYGFLTATGNGDTEAATATANTITIAPSTTAGKSSYVVNLYDTATKTTLLKTLTLPVSFKGATGTAGVAGSQSTTVYLYQWSATDPGAPSGSSSYTWATATHASWSGSGWAIAVGTNPGTSGVKLWVAALAITDVGTATTTTIPASTGTFNWVGATRYAATQNGAAGTEGTKAATAIVYQWALTIPAAPSGSSSVYTWSTGALDVAPSGWALTPGTSPSAGYTLWGAAMNLIVGATTTSTTITWPSSPSSTSITARGYSGTNGSNGSQGASIRTAYARIASNPSAVAATVTKTGDVRPDAGDTAWGAAFQVAWAVSDPTPTSTNSLYQTDGIYNPVTNQTVWSAPYISALKVGSLSAITVNTGALTVNDVLTIGTTGAVEGGQTDYSTGNGFFLGYSAGAYKFSVGSSTGNQLTWNGTTLSVPAATITGTLTAGQIAANAITADKILITSKGNALNDDPGIQDISAWELIGTGTTRLSGTTATGAAGTNYFSNSTGGSNAAVFSRQIQIDPAKTYLLTANLYAASTSNRTMYIAVNMYDAAGAQVATSPNWGGTYSGYVYGGVPTVGTWARYGAQFGAGVTGRLIPSNVVSIKIGVLFQYTGSTSVQQAAQDIRLERVNDGNLIVDGSVTATKINSNGLTIRAVDGTIILNAGANLAASTFGGAIDSTATINGTAASTVVTNAAAGPTGVTNAATAQGTANTAVTNAATAQSTADGAATAASAAATAAADRLSKSAQNVLAGSGGLAVGTLTWNTSGVRTGGYGIGFSANGLAAYNSAGTATFSLDGATGNATFAGALSAATGTFSGSLSAATGNFNGAVNVGSFTGYAWPTAGLSGAHLSSSGFLIGNATSGGKYFQIATGSGVGTEASISTNIPAFVNTVNIGDNQVTFPVAAFTPGVINTPATEVEIQTVTILTSGAPVIIWAGAFVEVYSGFGFSTPVSHSVTLKLKRGTTVLQTMVITANQSDNMRVYGFQSFAPYKETPTAASHTYTLTATGLYGGIGGSNGQTGSASNRGLVVMEAKR